MHWAGWLPGVSGLCGKIPWRSTVRYCCSADGFFYNTSFSYVFYCRFVGRITIYRSNQEPVARLVLQPSRWSSSKRPGTCIRFQGSELALPSFGNGYFSLTVPSISFLRETCSWFLFLGSSAIVWFVWAPLGEAMKHRLVTSFPADGQQIYQAIAKYCFFKGKQKLKHQSECFRKKTANNISNQN